MAHSSKSFLLVVLFFLFAMTGCHPTDDSTSVIDSDETNDSGYASCLENPDFFQNLNLSIDERMATVPNVTWSSIEATTSHVVFGIPDSPSMASLEELVPTRVHQTFLLGLKQSREYVYQVVSHTDDGDYCSAVQTFSTGRLDESLPELTLSINDSSQAAGGYTMLSLSNGVNDNVIIIDSDADIVWAHDTQSDSVYRVRLSLDHKALLYNNIADKSPTINRISLDGLEITQTSVFDMHHDFVETENGAYATLGVDIQAFSTSEGEQDFCGDTILEVAANGSSREVWNIFDWFEPDPDTNYHESCSGNHPGAMQWSHSNSLWYEASENAYYLTLRYLDKACKIDRDTGQLLWCVGGKDSEFTSIGEDTILKEPHSVLPVDGGLLVFENYDELADGCSTGAEISLDFTSWTAQETWFYGTDTCVLNPIFGNIDPLINGNRMLVLGVLGQIDETTLDKETVWRVNTPLNYTFAYGNRFESLY